MPSCIPGISNVCRALPPVLAALLYVGITGVALIHALAATGVAVYALDDVYIHMALAKNLVEHGVYGVTPFEATHASSSPLWVGLLATGFAVVGTKTWLPGVLAALSALAVVAVANACLKGPGPGSATYAAISSRTGLLCLIVLAAPLPALTLQGMEHPLHAALMLLGAWLGARAIAVPRPAPGVDGILLAVCVLLPLLRYESLWLHAVLAFVFLCRGRPAFALSVALAGAVPVCAVGLLAMAHDLTFLPAPILAKAIGPLLLADDALLRLAARLTAHPFLRIARVPLLAVLFLAGAAWIAVMLWRHRRTALDEPRTAMVALFVAGTWMHATFATFGWGARYEAYLIVLGLAALGAVAIDLAGRLQPERRSHRIAALLGGLAVALTIYTGFGRTILTYRNAQHAIEEVHRRDVFVARFLHEAYPQQGVLAMNIGAVVWFGEPRLTDALALGTPAVLRLFLAGGLSPQSLDALAAARNVRVFVVFDGWFREWTGGDPPWLKVAEIDAGTARRRLVLSLYARDPAEAAILAGRLQAFAAARPGAPTVTILPPGGG